MRGLVFYHGSSEAMASPQFKKRRPYNDCGLGLYCMEQREFTRVRACAEEGAYGFANEYLFDLQRSRMFYLSCQSYTMLN